VHGSQAVEVPKWGCFSCAGTQGTGVQLEATLPRSVYANGDIIPIELEVTNNRESIPRGLVLALTQIYTVRAGSDARGLQHRLHGPAADGRASLRRGRISEEEHPSTCATTGAEPAAGYCQRPDIMRWSRCTSRHFDVRSDGP
jgi:hypothetical protein